MKFSVLSDSLEKMEKTSKRLELTGILVELLKKTPNEIIAKVLELWMLLFFWLVQRQKTETL